MCSNFLYKDTGLKPIVSLLFVNSFVYVFVSTPVNKKYKNKNNTANDVIWDLFTKA